MLLCAHVLLCQRRACLPAAARNPSPQVLKECWLYLTTRNPSTVQPELGQLSFLDHALPFVVWGIVVSFGLAL